MRFMESVCTLYGLASGLVLGDLGSAHRARGCAGLPPFQAVQAAVIAFSYDFLQRKDSSDSIWKPVFPRITVTASFRGP